jgi:hypothetical protein
LPRVKYGAWGFALSLGTSRDRLRFGAAAASLRAACLRRSFSTARDHGEFHAAAAISAGCRPLSIAVSRGSALGWARTSMTRSSGCVVATLAEMGSAPNTSRCATCGQVGHLKICRSIEGAQRRGSPTITCIRRISAPHAAHRMTRTPQPTPAPRALRCQAISADCRQSPFWFIQLRDGALKPHPGLKLELRSQGLCREDACVLCLDVELVRPGPGRPPQSSIGRQPTLTGGTTMAGNRRCRAPTRAGRRSRRRLFVDPIMG